MHDGRGRGIVKKHERNYIKMKRAHEAKVILRTKHERSLESFDEEKNLLNSYIKDVKALLCSRSRCGVCDWDECRDTILVEKQDQRNAIIESLK